MAPFEAASAECTTPEPSHSSLHLVVGLIISDYTMKATRFTSLLALFAGTAIAGGIQEITTLKPISKGGKGLQARADDSSVAPSKSVGLDYGIDAEPIVHVELDMQRPAVLLEDVASIDNVTCAEDSISVSFASGEDFKAAVATWSNKGDLVFFTNHLGGCDTGAERGIFLVNRISGNAETLTVVAHAEKKDIASTAGETPRSPLMSP